MKAVRQKMDWTAQWIWSPGKTLRPIHVTYFRKEVGLKKATTEAILHCAADSKYRLWVNGEYLGFGPARGHRDHPYYDSWRISLRA